MAELYKKNSPKLIYDNGDLHHKDIIICRGRQVKSQNKGVGVIYF